MHVEYDADTDAAFIFLVEDGRLTPGVIANEVWPPELHERIGLLFDGEQKLLGLEVVGASALLPARVLAAARKTGDVAGT
jgi:uncharacterized protein YuzE